jgi:hypothetical protein
LEQGEQEAWRLPKETPAGLSLREQQFTKEYLIYNVFYGN